MNAGSSNLAAGTRAGKGIRRRHVEHGDQSRRAGRQKQDSGESFHGIPLQLLVLRPLPEWIPGVRRASNLSNDT
jgi:hypothetical protein